MLLPLLLLLLLLRYTSCSIVTSVITIAIN